MAKKKKHKFSRTVIDHHDDGSSTTTHEHESGDPKLHKRYSRADHDSMIDGLMEHTGDMNEGEGSDYEGKPYPSGDGHLPVGPHVPKGAVPEI